MNYIDKIKLFEEKYNLRGEENLYQKIVFKLIKVELPISLVAPFWLNFLSFGILCQFFTICLFFFNFFITNPIFFNTLVTLCFWSMLLFSFILSLQIEFKKKHYSLIKSLWYKENNKSFMPEYQLFLKTEKEKVFFFLLYLPPLLFIIYCIEDSSLYCAYLLALFLTYNGFKNIQSYRQIRAWKRHEADSIKFDIGNYESFLVTFDLKNRQKLYFPKIEFRYSIDGAQYTSNNIYIDQYSRKDLFFLFYPETITEWIYKHQNHTHIYYNPKKRNEALFSKEVSIMGIIQEIFISIVSWLLPLALYTNKIWLG